MLGIDLCKELAQDCGIYGIDIAHSPQSTVHSFEKGDITDKDNIAGIVNRIRPDVVIHAAAMTNVDECELDRDKAYKINFLGVKNVALACKASDAVLIYISTDFVFDGKSKTPYKETDACGPLSVYGDSKLKGEEAVREELQKYFILRTSWLYGEYGKNFVDTIIAKAKTEKVLKVVNDQVGSPTYTKDLSRAIHALLGKIEVQDSGVYHVSNSGSTSWYEYAKEILRLAAIKTEVKAISSQDLNRPARRPAMSVMDSSKFSEFTGYKFRDWKEALKEYICK